MDGLSSLEGKVKGKNYTYQSGRISETMFTTFFPEEKTAGGELQHASNFMKIKSLKTMPSITKGYLSITKYSKMHGDNKY